MRAHHPGVALTVALLAVHFATSGATSSSAEPNQEAEFVALFDGKSLAGWEGNLEIFHVEQAAIVAGSLRDRIANNEFLCTRQEFDNFELRLKAKLVGEGRNAGIQFRSKRIPNHHEVVGYQCDMGVSGVDHVIWGALYDESRRRKFLAEGAQEKLVEALKPEDWNDFVIRCEGSHIQIWLNGYQAVDYVETEDVAKTGVIALQIHGGKPALASYKDIRIKKLAATPKK